MMGVPSAVTVLVILPNKPPVTNCAKPALPLEALPFDGIVY